ncbi:PREDICTED: uncharacterized protein LOC109483802 isoform X2 [Branchiostoma belcheri]|uniref:Uncharacterized protein LOC109483802 isoform X2 n=1 Tax=Branchiostoma belcheri TaxID=7741 RepID=A0A6P5A8E7_BRABE|nr:PREDICTED: uncharacterized protein LOC109483802 isoform X2 [Branchiostoma belcheri]
MSVFVSEGVDVRSVVASHLKKYGYVDVSGDPRLRQVCRTRYGNCRLHQCLGEQCLPVLLGQVLTQMHPSSKQIETLCHISVYYPGAKKLSTYFSHLLPPLLRLISGGVDVITDIRGRDAAVRKRRIGATLVHTMLLAGGCQRHALALCESGAVPVLGRILSGNQDVPWCPYKDKVLMVHLLQLVVEIGDERCWQCVRKIERELSEVWKRHREAAPGDVRYKLHQAVGWLLSILRRGKMLPQSTKRRRDSYKQYFQFPVVCSSSECSNIEAGSKFKMCAACGLARYCSTACQTHHWGHGHKPNCKAMVAFDKANGARVI